MPTADDKKMMADAVIYVVDDDDELMILVVVVLQLHWEIKKTAVCETKGHDNGEERVSSHQLGHEHLLA
jgi:hypothetical protein